MLLFFTPYGSTPPVECLFDPMLFDAVIFDTCSVTPPVTVTQTSGLFLNPPKGWKPIDAMQAVPYQGPTITSERISQAKLNAATRKFARRRAEDEWLLGLIDDRQWLAGG